MRARNVRYSTPMSEFADVGCGEKPRNSWPTGSEFTDNGIYPAWQGYTRVPILYGRLRFGEGLEFGGNLGCLGRADTLENLHGQPQPVFCLGGIAVGQGAPA